MKFSKLIVLLLILSVAIQASPRDRRHHHRSSKYHHHYRYSRPHYNHYIGYNYYRYYTPTVVTTRSTTTYPKNLVLITAESVAEEVVALNRLMERGIISEKDYAGTKKTLLNRIGMSVNPDAQTSTTREILDQIETLYQMNTAQLITDKEYKKQKKKLLALI